jgi:photosystem II Psb28-2 protein
VYQPTHPESTRHRGAVHWLERHSGGRPLATIEFISGIREELTEIKLRRGQTSGNRIVVFIFEKVKAMDKLSSFSSGGAQYMLLNDEEGDIQVTPRNLEFFYKSDDNLAKLVCTFELINDLQWQRLRRFMDRYAASNGMEYQDHGPQDKMKQ